MMSRNVCNKIRFTTEAQAAASAARTAETARRNGDHWPIGHYFHKVCGYWHVGHTPTRVLARQPDPATYRTKTPVKPLAAYLDNPEQAGDLPHECRLCGYPLQWSRKAGWTHPSNVGRGHQPDPILVVDRVCTVCDQPVIRSRRNRLTWRHANADLDPGGHGGGHRATPTPPP